MQRCITSFNGIDDLFLSKTEYIHRCQAYPLDEQGFRFVRIFGEA